MVRKGTTHDYECDYDYDYDSFTPLAPILLFTSTEWLGVSFKE